LSQSIRVMIVDDEERFALGLAKLLKARGFEAQTAFDGFKALEAMEQGGQFDVVVLDIKMPGLDGIATLTEIKRRAPESEVIMLTGHATIESGTRAMRLGAYDYLMKPCDIEDLVEKIKEAHEAESIKRHPVLWPRHLVREIPLSSFEKLGPEDSLGEALAVLSRESGEAAVDEVFVVDPQGRLCGLVTKRDLVYEAQQARPELHVFWSDLCENPSWLPAKELSQIVRPAPLSAGPEENLTEVAQRMIAHNLRCLPVISAGAFLGVARIQDIFHYVDHETE